MRPRLKTQLNDNLIYLSNYRTPTTPLCLPNCHFSSSNRRNIKHLPFPSKECGHFILIINTIFSLMCVVFFKSEVKLVKEGARRLCFMSAVDNSEVTWLMQPFRTTAFHCSFISRDFEQRPLCFNYLRSLHGCGKSWLRMFRTDLLTALQNAWPQVR